jgi:putative ABC transport system permease protein
MKWALYWRYATRSLVRGGQRTVLAVFCVAVGVLAIVALQLVALSVNQSLLANIVEANGGDLRVRALDILPLHQADLAYFAQLKTQGRITDYATVAGADGAIILPDGTETDFSLVAVSPNYPLVGQPNFQQPVHDLTIQQIVRGDTVAVSQDVFTQLHARIGDQFTVKTRDGVVIPVTIGAEFADGGAFFSGELVMAQATFFAAPGPSGKPQPASYTSVAVTAPAANVNSVAVDLQKHFPSTRVITAQDLLKQRQQQVNYIHLFLHLVGLLALFIGGVGIINTMQVMLRRRGIEIAMLKAAGYRQRDLAAMFGLEAALLGALGGAVGAAAGVGASFVVRAVVAQAFFLHLPIVLDPLSIAAGVIIGMATALIFGLLPIVQSSAIRPLAVLRESDEGRPATSRLGYRGLLALLALLFIALATAILGNPLYAALAVIGGLIAVGALGLCFGLLVAGIARLPVFERPRARMLLWIAGAVGIALLGGVAFTMLAGVGAALAQGFGPVGIGALVLLGGLGIILASCAVIYLVATLLDSLVMFAPRGWKTVIMLAYRNMGRQRVRTTTLLTALFVGVFGIGMVLVLGQGIRATIDQTLQNALHYNVFVLTPPIEAASVQSALSAVPGVDPAQVAQSVVGRIAPAQIGSRQGVDLIKWLEEQDDLDAFYTIEGFNLHQAAPVITLKDGRDLNAGDSGTNNAVLAGYLQDAPVSLRVGDTVVVASRDGTVKQTLTIVGFYDTSTPGGNPNFGNVLTDEAVAQRLAGVQRLTIFSLHIQPTTLPLLRRAVTQHAVGAFVFSLVDLTALVDQVLNGLIVMLTTIASLAMLAGLIIIANAVALAMLERRREIGILKSVGHTSASVLATVLVENGLVGALGALVAMLLVVGAVVAIGLFVIHITLLVAPLLIAAIIAVTALVTMAVAALVAWGATRVRPLEVLRYE